MSTKAYNFRSETDNNFDTESNNITDSFSYKNNYDLIKRYKEKHEEEILNIILVINYRLIKRQAGRYKKVIEGTCLSTDDLIQVGYIGLIKALERYDLSRKTSFSTYALYWIKQRMTREISNRLSSVRIPVYMGEEFLRVRKSESKISEDIDYEEKVRLVCEDLGMTPEKYEEIKGYESLFGGRLTSLNIEIGEEESVPLMEIISSDESNDIVFDNVSDAFLKEGITDALNKLSEREANILSLRFGINDGREMTLEEIGKIYGLTRERIRQIEAKALLKLSNNKAVRHLKEGYMENR